MPPPMAGPPLFCVYGRWVSMKASSSARNSSTGSARSGARSRLMTSLKVPEAPIEDVLGSLAALRQGVRRLAMQPADVGGPVTVLGERLRRKGESRRHLERTPEQSHALVGVAAEEARQLEQHDALGREHLRRARRERERPVDRAADASHRGHAAPPQRVELEAPAEVAEDGEVARGGPGGGGPPRLPP